MFLSRRQRTGADSSLVNTLSGHCPDATGAGCANGTKLQIWTCGGSEQQNWILPTAAPPRPRGLTVLLYGHKGARSRRGGGPRAPA
ncbi:RICIN domain-containing protein [Streptomyces sp. NPDC056930]|uniref:RICIN domain-containing protein n=1 Tax=Streptomyces sp. NPDC056930 TaxID=3345967 RepID=UPI00362563E5